MKIVNVEYEHPAGRATTWGARVHFLEQIEDLAPEVLDGLRGEPLKRYLETGIAGLDLTTRDRLTRKTYRDISTFWRKLKDGQFLCEYYVNEESTYPSALRQQFIHPACAKAVDREWTRARSEGLVSDIDFMFTTKYRFYPSCPYMTSLWEGLEDWAHRFNLIEKEGGRRWCLESAYYTLDAWAREPEHYKEMGLSALGTSESSPYLKPIDPPDGFDEWQPDWEERDVYLKNFEDEIKEDLKGIRLFKNHRRARRVVKLLLEEADEYCDRVERHYRENGWEKIRSRPEIVKHIKWTVGFQVQGKSFNEIGESEDVAAKNVKKEVEKILDLIGLSRRPNAGLRGRRPGQKDSPSAKITRRLGRQRL